MEPSNKGALLSLAWLEYNEAQNLPRIDEKLAMIDRAAKTYGKIAGIDPVTRARSTGLGAGRFGWLTDEKVRGDLRPKYDNAVKQLTRALEIDPASSDAMVFMSLCLRERADSRHG